MVVGWHVFILLLSLSSRETAFGDLPSLHIPMCTSTQPQSYLLSAGIDGVIKFWEVAGTPAPGSVLKSEAVHTFDREQIAEEKRREEGGQRRPKVGSDGQSCCLSSTQTASSV